MRYRIEIWRNGRLSFAEEFDQFYPARRFYLKYWSRDDGSTELYIDGERLRYIDALRLMRVRMPLLDFREDRRTPLCAD